jgi:hypothetical protein
VIKLENIVVPSPLWSRVDTPPVSALATTTSELSFKASDLKLSQQRKLHKNPPTLHPPWPTKWRA